RVPSRAAWPSATGCRALVTPVTAETTTRTRVPSSPARRFIRPPIVSQRSRRDTLVPPNFRTIQSGVSAPAAGAAWLMVSGGGGRHHAARGRGSLRQARRGGLVSLAAPVPPVRRDRK